MTQTQHDNNPLLVSKDEALEILSIHYKDGMKLKNDINAIYNLGWNKPLNINSIRALKFSLVSWIKNNTDSLNKIYSNSEYLVLFNSSTIDEKYFELTPEALKINMQKLYEDVLPYKLHLAKADAKEKINIYKEINKKIGNIKPHWDYEKSRMVQDLKAIVSDKLEFLNDRILYLEEFGLNNSVMLLELPIVDFSQKLIEIFPDPEQIKYKPIDFPDKFLEDAFKISNLEDVIKGLNRKYLRKPIRPIIEIASSKYNKNQYFQIRDEIIYLKQDFGEVFKSIAGIDLEKLISRWGDDLPIYNYNDHHLSFEKLKDSVINTIYQLAIIPGKLYQSPLTKSKKTAKKKRGSSKAIIDRNKKINKEYYHLHTDKKLQHDECIKKLAKKHKLAKSTINDIISNSPEI